MSSDDRSPSLFEAPATEPLAARMRPRTLTEFIGQRHILAPGRLLRRAIEADQLSSLIFYGPPGTGKTTLARVIANSTRARFIAINAVLAGVKDIREAVAAAQASRRAGAKTILFVDEVHRFNKAQQDALLPWVENGTVILVGATTENPYFEVNKALVSRSRIFQLVPLTDAELRDVARQALADAERGYGDRDVELDDEALDHLANVANGDARALLNALELAVETTPAVGGVVRISLEVAEESIQRRAVLYDKEGDAHFDTVSAFIKSVRGSDPDAALYWLAKMIYAGEDPRFVLRRLLILASEDVGLADPQALVHTAAAAQAFENVGMPEGRYHLSQATLYLATAPKSNSTMAFFDALSAVEREREEDVPSHLKDASRDREALGHGAGYAYPHAYRDHWVAQQYLPDSLQGQAFYAPSNSGYEATIRADVARRREAQLAAMLETEPAPPTLTVNARSGSSARWIERAVSTRGQRLAEVRAALFELTPIAAHAVVLDLQPGSGLLTWEAVRRTPAGQVYALEPEASAAAALEAQASNLPELERPVVLRGALRSFGPGSVGEVRFDAVIGRGAVAALAAPLSAPLTAPLTAPSRSGEAPQAPRSADPADQPGLGSEPSAELGDVFGRIRRAMAPGGVLTLAEVDLPRAQRLYALVDLGLEPELTERLRAAEEALYATGRRGGVRALFGPEPEGVAAALARAGFRDVSVTRRTFHDSRRLTRETVGSWFSQGGERASYADHLRGLLSEAEVASVKERYLARLADSEVAWTTPYYFIRAVAGSS